MLKSPRPLFQERQIVLCVKQILVALITARMARDKLLVVQNSIRNGYALSVNVARAASTGTE